MLTLDFLFGLNEGRREEKDEEEEAAVDLEGKEFKRSYKVISTDRRINNRTFVKTKKRCIFVCLSVCLSVFLLI